jgi:hypothetical protein
MALKYTKITFATEPQTVMNICSLEDYIFGIFLKIYDDFIT